MSEEKEHEQPSTPMVREVGATYAVATTGKAGVNAVAAQRKRNEGALRLLESWRNCTEEEAEEQRETWEYLKRVLDEDRPSYRKLFP